MDFLPSLGVPVFSEGPYIGIPDLKQPKYSSPEKEPELYLNEVISDFPQNLKDAIITYCHAAMAKQQGHFRYSPNEYSYIINSNKNHLLSWYDSLHIKYDRSNIDSAIFTSTSYQAINNGPLFKLKEFIFCYLLEIKDIDYKELPYCAVTFFLKDDVIGRSNNVEEINFEYDILKEIFLFWQNKLNVARTTSSIEEIIELSKDINVNIRNNIASNKNTPDHVMIDMIIDSLNIFHITDILFILNNICLYSTSEDVIKFIIEYYIEKNSPSINYQLIRNLILNDTYINNYNLVTKYPGIISWNEMLRIAERTKSQEIMNFLASFSENEKTIDIIYALSLNKNISDQIINKIINSNYINAKISLINNDHVVLSKCQFIKMIEIEESLFEKDRYLYQIVNDNFKRESIKSTIASKRQVLDYPDLLERLLNDKDEIVSNTMRKTLNSVLELL